MGRVTVSCETLMTFARKRLPLTLWREIQILQLIIFGNYEVEPAPHIRWVLSPTNDNGN
jgi:hypothetical protein